MFKDKDAQRAYNKERMRKARVTQTGSTEQGSTPSGNTEETVPALYIQGIKGRYQELPERPRFLTLSDEQVYDRVNPPSTISLKCAKELMLANDAKHTRSPYERINAAK